MSSLTRPKIFLVGNREKPDAEALYWEIGPWIREHADLVGGVLGEDLGELSDAKEVDFVVVLGGDGSILHAGRALGTRQVPIIGVNLGKLGYLADFDPDEFKEKFDAIIHDRKVISSRMMFNVKITGNGEPTFEGIALNDCVVRVCEPYRTLSLSLQLNNSPLCKLHGDGVIVATPTGSTAHNMSCGGPLVEPEVDATIMTPRCPHSFTHRPIVLSGSSILTIRLISESQTAAAVLDGQHVRRLKEGDKIEVTRSETRFSLVRNPDRRPWETMITKLKWGLDIR